jgi:membrane-bound lytic murein transglycosylase B
MVERSMRSRVLLSVLLGVGILALVAFAAYAFLQPIRNLVIDDGAEDAADATWAPASAAPVRAATQTTPGVGGLVDADWLAATAEATGIPEIALSAYAGVAITKADQMPGCGLGWNTLAAIGWAESRHGTHGGSVVGPDGTVTPGIFGVALDGGDTEVITDTDGGTIDGDTVHDRAVGPMQLIPQTWRNWHVDVSGDGVEDPQNIFDATMATANYLCRASGDMTTESGWRAGIAAYNSAPAYITGVANAGTRYAADAS